LTVKTMNEAYRDDLEAALARASDLEREVEALRRRNAELESGDRATIEARENARRLEAALERERDELRQRFENDLDAELARRQSELARRDSEQHRRDSELASDRQQDRPLEPFAVLGVTIICLGAFIAIAAASTGGLDAGIGGLCVFGAFLVLGIITASRGDGDASDDRATRT
jgi:predicted RNase H-like nuclease (RuvC/YqgF family)